jgi:hypothetical protein
MGVNFHQQSQTIDIRSNLLEKIMNDRFESLASGEVVSVQHDAQVLSGHRTFRVGELSESIESHLAQAIADWNEQKKAWFSDRGIDCEALRFGSNGWQKGRIRLCLEFCPDDPSSSAQNIGDLSTPTTTQPNPATVGTANIAQPQSSISDTATNLHHQQPESTANTVAEMSPSETVPQPEHGSTVATAEQVPAVSPTDEDNFHKIAIPVVGIAAMGTVAAAAVATTPDWQASTNLEQPPLVDTILEQEDRYGDRHAHHQSFDEIAFDFDTVDRDLAINSSSSTMELDLTDLGLDFNEQDLLSFEVNGMSDASAEFANLQDLDRPENSGMLIDEVWNEMNQGNWPGIN